MVKIPLAAARAILGMTQDELGEVLGLTRATIGKYEAGKAVSPVYIYAMAQLTGIPVDDFLLPEEFTKSKRKK